MFLYANGQSGNYFKSVSAMIRHYGIPRPTYISRLKSGRSMEEVLSTSTQKRKIGTRKRGIAKCY